MPFVWAFAIGAVAGLRSMIAPAAVSWAARLGHLQVENTWLAFFGYPATAYLVTALALGELIADKPPKAPNRTAPLGFVGRMITGGLSGAALGATNGSWIGGLLAGVLGAVAGTLGGFQFRARLTRANGGKDLPVALLEDGIAILGAAFLVSTLSRL